MTLHVRLTRDCNAHCSYCSSAGRSQGRMAPDEFRSSIDFICDHVLPRIGHSRGDFITVEYLGGEILLVPQDELEAAVLHARRRLSERFRGIRDGAQSNLQGAPRRIMALNTLFSGNVGTSSDAGAGQRRLRGSTELYQALLTRSSRALAQVNGREPGRVVVVDRHSAPHILEEIRIARARGYDLVLRPVFQGGSGDIQPLDPAALADLLQQAYLLWSRAPEHRVEPFSTLFARRMARGRRDPSGAPLAPGLGGCPFQSDCATKSLSLDPDGTLYICQEMADSGHYPLGNAIEGRFDEHSWRLLARRSLHLDAECSRCAWRDECAGGCMNEAIATHGDPFARTELCPAWKAIFSAIEADIRTGQAACMLAAAPDLIDTAPGRTVAA